MNNQTFVTLASGETFCATTRDTESLKGRQFKVDRYDCVWTVRVYHRNDAWICEEPVYNTRCEFYETEILTGLLEVV
jgi:hypothetical protein